MTEGLGSYRRQPMRWAVDTVIEGNSAERGDSRSADELVENVWEFIEASFEEQALPLPNREILISRVARRLGQVREENRK